MSNEIVYLQTADGEYLYVPDDDVRFLVYGGFGAPPANFITRKGYKQHGVTEVDYLLEPRTISAHLWHSPACSRQLYWSNRLALHEFLRPNRGGPLWFVLVQPGGTKRALVVRANPGLQFPMPDTDQNAWNVDETVDFVAYDPVWFDPDVHTTAQTVAIEQELVFPITFPIRFDELSYTADIAITYPGTWACYPTITIDGPYDYVVLDNTATGVRIRLNGPVAGGDQRIITLTPGAQHITDASGANRFSDLDITSDLVDFCLQPDPIVPGGVQTIRATAIGGAAGTTRLRLDYYDRYFAI